MSKGEDVLLFDALISILLFAYGATTGVGGVAIPTFQTPLLAATPKGQIQNCQNTDAGCIASNLALATAYVGWAIVNIPVLIIFFTQIFFVFGNGALATSFSTAGSQNGVPFLGIFFVALQLYAIWEVMRTIRGSSVGV